MSNLHASHDLAIMGEDPYAILGLHYKTKPQEITKEQIKDAFNHITKGLDRKSPDFKDYYYRAQAAFDLLTDPQRRKAYDECICSTGGSKFTIKKYGEKVNTASSERMTPRGPTRRLVQNG
jgi:DnaJ-class molecular chaperone